MFNGLYNVNFNNLYFKNIIIFFLIFYYVNDITSAGCKHCGDSGLFIVLSSVPRKKLWPVKSFNKYLLYTERMNN